MCYQNNQFSKPSGFKYHKYFQAQIHYSNRRHTQKNNIWSWKSADTAKTSSDFENFIQDINPR